MSSAKLQCHGTSQDLAVRSEFCHLVKESLFEILIGSGTYVYNNNNV